MKKFNKLFFFLIFFTFSFLLLIPYVSAQEEADATTYDWNFATIDYTWLGVDVSPFIDKHTDDGTGKFLISEGGHDLKEFKNTGLLSIGDGVVVYGAEMIFGFELNYFTSCLPQDIIPAGDFDRSVSREYVHVIKYTIYDIIDPDRDYLNREDIRAKITYRDVSLGPSDTWNVHDYDGLIPLTVSMVPDFASKPEIEINGIVLKQPEIVSEIKAIEIVETRSDNVGDYDDIYVGQDQLSGGVTGTPTASNPSLGSGSKSGEVIEKINNLNLGWSYGERSEGLTLIGGSITGQATTIAKEEGSIWINKESIDSYSFDLAARLKPEITYDTQDVKIRWARLEWDSDDTLFSPSLVKVLRGPEDRPRTRVTSLHVRNRFVHTEFEVRVNMIATAKYDPEFEERILADPFLEIGDFVWDENMEGTSDMEIAFAAPLQDFFADLLGGFGIFIIIAIVLMIGYALIKIVPGVVSSISKSSRERKIERLEKKLQTRQYQQQTQKAPEFRRPEEI